MREEDYTGQTALQLTNIHKRDGFLVSVLGLGLVAETLGVRFGRTSLAFVAAGCFAVAIYGFLRRPRSARSGSRRVGATIFAGIIVFGSTALFAFWTKPAGLDPNERAYLKPVCHDAWRWRRSIVRAPVVTANVGTLGAEPGAVISSVVLISGPLSRVDEDRAFANFVAGNGVDISQLTRANYFDAGDRMELDPEAVLGSTPDEVEKNWQDVKSGNKLIYVFSRSVYRDNIGKMSVESCSVFRLAVTYAASKCLGHNGAMTLP
jgi:hypothetical protein